MGRICSTGRTSYIAGRTWKAHTTADELTLNGEIEPVILVGVANTGLRRMAEYTPTRDFKMGGGDGQSYGRLLVEELKPLIDRYLPYVERCRRIQGWAGRRWAD